MKKLYLVLDVGGHYFIEVRDTIKRARILKKEGEGWEDIKERALVLKRPVDVRIYLTTEVSKT